MIGCHLSMQRILFLFQVHLVLVKSTNLATEWPVNVTSDPGELLRDDVNSNGLFESTGSSVDVLNFTDNMASFVGRNVTPPKPIVSSCTAFILDFSEAAAEYTKCSITYARPFRFCENCIDAYLRTAESYHNIMEGTFHDDSGALCSDAILNSDRIQIVVQTFKFVERLWADSHCIGCFQSEDQSTRHDINNDTEKFLELANETSQCFGNFTHRSRMSASNISVDPAICESCKESYRNLNIFYEHLLVQYPDSVCMDIVDIMNTTRLDWSMKYHCSLHNVDITPVVLLSIFFSCLPVLFYVSNKIHGTKTEKKLLKQKRLRESQLNSHVEEEAVS